MFVKIVYIFVAQKNHYANRLRSEALILLVMSLVFRTGKVVPKNPAVSQIMKGNKAQGTKPELLLRKKLVEAGIRYYRINYAKLRGKPDIVFVGKKVAVFLHGCFWHQCPYCKPPMPRHNMEFWKGKLNGNKERDRITKKELRKMGWKVVVVWECQLKKSPEKQIERIRMLINE